MVSGCSRFLLVGSGLKEGQVAETISATATGKLWWTAFQYQASTSLLQRAHRYKSVIVPAKYSDRWKPNNVWGVCIPEVDRIDMKPLPGVWRLGIRDQSNGCRSLFCEPMEVKVCTTCEVTGIDRLWLIGWYLYAYMSVYVFVIHIHIYIYIHIIIKTYTAPGTNSW